jgi:hypothetical protein
MIWLSKRPVFFHELQTYSQQLGSGLVEFLRLLLSHFLSTLTLDATGDSSHPISDMALHQQLFSFFLTYNFHLQFFIDVLVLLARLLTFVFII